MVSKDKYGDVVVAPVVSPKTGTASVVGGSTDGKNLFLVVEVVKGEKTLRLEPVFPFETSTTDINEYLKSLIEDSPEFPPDVAAMFQSVVYWDPKEESWYTRSGNGVISRQK